MTRVPELEEETALANIALDLLGQARLLLAPRPASVEGRGRDRGPARLLPRRARVPQRPPGRARRRRLRRAGRPAARLLHLAAGAVRAPVRLARPGARGDRRQGRQGADLPPRLRRAVGRPPRRRHRPSHAQDAGRAGRGLAARRRAVPPDAERRSRAIAVDRAIARRGRRRARHRARRPPRSTGRSAAPLAAVAGGPDATACTPRRSATCSPSCSASPAPIRTRHGDAPAVRTASRPRCRIRSCRC